MGDPSESLLRDRRILPSTAVSLVGVSLLGLQHLSFRSTYWNTHLLFDAVPILLAIVLMAAGVFLFRSDFNYEESLAIFLSTLAGLTVLFLAGLSAQVHQELQGKGIVDPLHFYLSFVGIGGVAGLVFGRIYVEMSRDRRRLEKKNVKLERVASVLSHDLRNPLNAAQLQLELARDRGD